MELFLILMGIYISGIPTNYYYFKSKCLETFPHVEWGEDDVTFSRKMAFYSYLGIALMNISFKAHARDMKRREEADKLIQSCINETHIDS